jgi:hypothetical protein
MRDVIALREAELLEPQRNLELLSSFRELERWRDALIEDNAWCNGVYGRPPGSLASELANQEEGARKPITRHFGAWERLLEDGFTRMKETGALRPEADAKTLATGLMAALQGGYLLAKAARDVNPMKIALDMALAHVGSYAASRDHRDPEAGGDA